MATKIEKSKLSRLLRETLGLAASQGAPIIVNEPPVVPVHPTPSVTGPELGNIKTTSSFESSQTMKNLGRFLSKLSEDQQQRVYKNLKKSAHKLVSDEANEQRLYSLIGSLIKEASIDMRDMDPKDAAGRAAQEDAYLDMIDSGDAEVDEDELRDFFAVGDPPQADNANLRREKYTKAELAKIDLMDPAHRMGVNALTVGEVIDAIAIQMGLGRSAVTNVLYDYMKKSGDNQIRRRPSERRAIPTSADQEKMGTAVAVETMLYDDFKEEIEGYGDIFPELSKNPYPEAIEELPKNDYRRELFRNYARLFLMTQYGSDIRSSIDLIANWHNLTDVTGNPPREHGNGRPHTQDSSLHGFIVGDVRELMGNMNSSDFEQYLKRAQALIDVDKTAGGQGWKGVVGKVDKQAEKVAKKKAKAKAKADKKK
jgi:hypothetical protein